MADADIPTEVKRFLSEGFSGEVLRLVGHRQAFDRSRGNQHNYILAEGEPIVHSPLRPSTWSAGVSY